MMIIALFIKFIYMLRILMKKNINILLKKSENNGLESLKDPNTFTEYSKSIQEYKYYYKK